ncbi:hypothetical protein BDQ12DRAFT_683791 [Crucibulum laeve]|uniref:Uncharacterized protein n=1 Tax=Crucibulum laeve TaxID=68775 RepID=A0A5C3LZI8_9AGAR|nr:hypothetical protein BDQ12DRAFT_683791 [Crucibulum laeve]
MPGQSQYTATSHIPLIKSPSLRVPRPVEMPPDIHPLPDSVTPYFVYPFTLEPHIITLESSRRTTIAAHAARREAYLRQREDEKERRRRDALRKIAPGFEPSATPLVPTRTQSTVPTNSGSPEPTSPTDGQGKEHQHTRSVMDVLVDQLAAIDSASSIAK